jgi:hypothetical protein
MFFVIKRVCVVSHWVHAAIGEGPALPALRCASHWSLGLHLSGGCHICSLIWNASMDTLRCIRTKHHQKNTKWVYLTNKVRVAKCNVHRQMRMSVVLSQLMLLVYPVTCRGIPHLALRSASLWSLVQSGRRRSRRCRRRWAVACLPLAPASLRTCPCCCH